MDEILGTHNRPRDDDAGRPVARWHSHERQRPSLPSAVSFAIAPDRAA
jgi:hypothetical protein